MVMGPVQRRIRASPPLLRNESRNVQPSAKIDMSVLISPAPDICVLFRSLSLRLRNVLISIQSLPYETEKSCRFQRVGADKIKPSLIF